MSLHIELRKPKVILFDWDDTLVETGKFYRSYLTEVLCELGITEWDKEAEDKYRHYSRREALPKIFGDRWQEVNDLFVHKVKRMHEENAITPMPYALEAIKQFSEDGIVMSVVSNKDGRHLREDVAKLEWTTYFHRIVGASDAARDKPWPEPAALAIQGIEIKKDDYIWLIGDSIVDMQCAQATDCTPILISNDFATKEMVKAMHLNHKHIETYQELLECYRHAN